MPCTVLIGTQFGDEGKGKLVDVLTPHFDAVVRFNGGANAGHTVAIKKEMFKLHLLPSAILHPQTRSLISAGVVVDPEILVQELEALKKRGVSVTAKQLGIDFRCPLVLPWHKELDAAREQQASKSIGTTRRGIGPAYEEQAARTGLRFEDLLDEKRLQQKFHESYTKYAKLLAEGYGLPVFSEEEWLGPCISNAKKLSGFAGDVSSEVAELLAKKRSVLFEGAQGTLLDLRYGTYPFVTAAPCISAAAPLATGLPPHFITDVEGVIKAYTTRVGNGPFPSELFGKLADEIREKGGEYGTTTGRARRVGWLDMGLLRYSARINGLHGFHLTKLDVLQGLSEIQVSTHYEVKGKKMLEFPANSADLEQAKPVYRTFEGFELPETIPKKGFSSLPKTALEFVNYIEKELGVPALSISYGPDRSQTVFR